MHLDTTGQVGFGLDVYSTADEEPLMMYVPTSRALADWRRCAHEYLDGLLDAQERLTAPF